MSRKPSSNFYTVAVDAYAAWLTANGRALDRMPRRGQIVEWQGSFRRTDGPLKPYDWLCRVQFEDGEEMELPFACLKPVPSSAD
jgi:hypothetical protein